MHFNKFTAAVIIVIISAALTNYFVGAALRFYVPDAEYTAYEKKYGKYAVIRLNALLDKMNKLVDENASDDTKVIEINSFFNQVQYQSDIKTWGKTDYWASRLEFLGVGLGDCEDYAVSKFLTLIQIGVPQEKLFLTYVKRGKESHLVVTYYKQPNTIPFVLDNYDKSIQLATNRKDLAPVYSFNANDLYLQRQQGLGARVDPSQSKNLNKLNAINLEIMAR